ncbi:TRAP transporter permease [Arenibaculum sp.]|uniref:TRAP transporter permease n=1 Tax=Arenibaculum sp. TaxID=2865862 RepID=UPI002E14CE72|nr:TRAP transporter permease [Arenibaculum sp.]
MTAPPARTELDRAALEAMVEEADLGGRKPGGAAAKLLMLVALAWSLFQLWYASPLPFALNLFILNDTEARSIHLAFAVFLTFTAYPAFRSSPRAHVPVADWLLALGGAFSAGYLYLFYAGLSLRPGLPTSLDLWVAAAGLLLLLECARRAVSPALTVVALVMIGYAFAGPWLPDLIAHKGASVSRAMSQYWLTTEGVFGVALGVSTSFVFLFVLFGSLLDKAGAGNYFIQLSFALLGHMRGGPAKAAVVSSGMTGLISGSSIANVVTTGTFTIPLMKRVGYPATKAGAVECAASVNGQIMPPVMGAAAFLIAEYVGIPYAQLVQHAFLPAIISYIALFYIVDLEAVKMGLRGVPRSRPSRGPGALAGAGLGFAGMVILAGAVYWGVGWTKGVLGAAAAPVLGALLVLVYVGLVSYRARYPDLAVDETEGALLTLPGFVETARTGLHFLLPVVVLVWCLMVEGMSPGLSAFWATLFLMGVVVTQRPLTALFRGETRLGEPLRAGLADLVDGLVAGARNMTGVGIATAAAGIVVGTVSLTGIGLVMTELVGFLSGGSLMVMLLLTAVICIVLGMGMPTTASYVVVATLMAPVMVELGAQNDLAVPLVAVHLFVFYFGLMADVTPPVGLASYAAAAISGADPVRTGAQAFVYAIRTALLPFLFIFNTELLMIGITGPLHAILVAASALAAMLLFVAATQGHFLVRSRWYETVALLLVCFTLFRPGFWMDMLYPPYAAAGPERVAELAEALPEGGFLRLRVEAESRTGRVVEKVVKLPMGGPGPGEARLAAAGLTLAPWDGAIIVDDVRFGSTADRLGLELDNVVLGAEIPAVRPAKHWMFLPALALLGVVVLLQRRRRPGAGSAGTMVAAAQQA